MNLYFDTEFTGLRKDTTLISIGIVSDDNRRFYAEFTDYDKSQVDDWVRENVLSHLRYKGMNFKQSYSKTVNADRPRVESYSVSMSGDSESIRVGLVDWMSQFDMIELVSDVCHYDMVLLLDLLSPDVPGHMSPSCHDINQDIARFYGITEAEAFDMSREDILKDFGRSIDGDKHNASYDSLVIREIYRITSEK